MSAKRIDLAGKVFGKLTVLEYSHSNRYAYWKCRCECGKETIVRSSHLIAGLVKTCGCSWAENGKKTVIHAQNANVIHGDSKSRLYNIWSNMLQRCENENATGFALYGGRGIKVCPEWHDYVVFKEWALKNGYRDDLTIDRESVNGNYEASNCRWADTETQANNTRRNIVLTLNNETMTASQWAKQLGISRTTFFRLLKQGKNLEDIARRRA
jgi:hypothetical protein